MSVADPTRLTRRDRAALTLALEWARWSHGSRDFRDMIALEDASAPLWTGGRVAGSIVIAMANVRTDRARVVDVHSLGRVMRARLALLLRALLRADALEHDAATLGLPAAIFLRWPPVCDGCGEPLPAYAIGDPVNICPKRGGHPVARQARPLWEHAPQTRPR